MPPIKAAYLEHQLKRWARLDAHQFVRADWRKFARPGSDDGHPFALYERKYRPDQLRVLAGSREGGQWTDEGGGGGGINDPRIISDAAPDDDWKPGAQYAQKRPPVYGGVLIVNGSRVEPTLAQSARLAAIEPQVQAAVRRVQELDPRWKPQAEMYNSVEGYIAARQNDLRQAEGRIRELQDQGVGPGRFAAESIPARGPGRSYTSSEIEKNNENGRTYGCHTCGTLDPGTRLGNSVLDHQPPSALNWSHNAQRIYPQCATCSARQGGFVNQIKRRQ